MKAATDLFLLNAIAGWRIARHERLSSAAPSTVVELQRAPGTARPLVDAAGTFGGLVLPAAMTMDADGVLYVLDGGPVPALKRYDPCRERFEALACCGGAGSEPRQFREPRGLALSRFGDLIVADTGNRRVQVFTKKGLALRLVLGPYTVTRIDGEVRLAPAPARSAVPVAGTRCQPSAEWQAGTWEPWDVASDPCGRFFVADREHGLIHVFNAAGCWQASWDGASPDSPALVRPIRLAVDLERRLYVVQEDRAEVVVFDSEGRFVERIETVDEARRRFRPLHIGVDPAGNVYLTNRATHRVHVHCPGDPCVWRMLPASSPFPAECSSIAFDRAGHPLLGDARRRCIVQVEAGARFEEEGHFVTEALDSGIHQCPWHRAVLTGSVPRGTQVQVDTFTAPAWKSDEEITRLAPSRWLTGQVHADPQAAEWDCLITSPPGRFLWLRVTLRGETTTSPSLTRVRLEGPRTSSLRFLPALYSENPEGADFLGRFLSIFDRIRGETTELLDRLAGHWDPAAAPASAQADRDFLGWLASWIGLALDRHWPEAQRRQLLRHAPRLYALRGTAAGLALHLRLYTGLAPRILEHFRVRRWLELGHGRLGDASRLFGAAAVRRLQLDEHAQIGEFQLIDSGDPLRDPFHQYAHQFTVFVPVACPASSTQRQTIQRIVEMAKPAHALARIEILEPRFELGTRSIVGLDTVLGRYPSGVKTGATRLGQASVLGPSSDEASPPRFRLGKRSRLGRTTLID